MCSSHFSSPYCKCKSVKRGWPIVGPLFCCCGDQLICTSFSGNDEIGHRAYGSTKKTKKSIKLTNLVSELKLIDNKTKAIIIFAARNNLPSCYSIACAFNDGDYTTAYIGKWHLYGSPDGEYGRCQFHVPRHYQLGFDTWKGFECNQTSPSRATGMNWSACAAGCSIGGKKHTIYCSIHGRGSNR